MWSLYEEQVVGKRVWTSVSGTPILLLQCNVFHCKEKKLDMRDFVTFRQLYLPFLFYQ